MMEMINERERESINDGTRILFPPDPSWNFKIIKNARDQRARAVRKRCEKLVWISTMGADIRGKRCCSLSIHDKTTFTPGCTSSLEQATLGMYIYIYIYGKLSRVAAWLTSLESIFQRTLKSRSIPSWWRDSCVRSSDHYTRYKLSHSSSHTRGRGPAHRYPRPILWHFFLFCNQSRIGLASARSQASLSILFKNVHARNRSRRVKLANIVRVPSLNNYPVEIYVAPGRPTRNRLLNSKPSDLKSSFHRWVTSDVRPHDARVR